MFIQIWLPGWGKLHALGAAGDAPGVWQRSGGVAWGSKWTVASRRSALWRSFGGNGLSMCKFHMCKSHFSCWFSSFYLIPHLSPGSKPQVLFGVSALHCDENSLGNWAGLYSIDLGFLVAQGQTLFYLSVESSGMPGRDCVKQLHRRFIWVNDWSSEGWDGVYS